MLTDQQINSKTYYDETSHDSFSHKLFAEHKILSVIFIPLENFYDLPVFDHLFFYSINLKSPDFLENFWLTGLCSKDANAMRRESGNLF